MSPARMVAGAGCPSAPLCLNSPRSLDLCLDELGYTCRNAHAEESRPPLQRCDAKREKSVGRSVQRNMKEREIISPHASGQTRSQ